MADDTVEQARQRLEAAIYAMTADEYGDIAPAIDALIAAVRAEKTPEPTPGMRSAVVVGKPTNIVS